MRYLFFDIECANSYGGKAKIYSFGYLITDENFNMLCPPEDILINPDSKFDPYVKKNILVYDRAMLKTMPKFNERYAEIKKLMTAKDVVCVGYGIDNDLKFLSDECERYELKKIKAKVYDVQKIIKAVEEKPARKLHLEFTERFGEQEEKPHRSDIDAVRTMMVCKNVLENVNKSIVQVYKEENLK